MNTTTEVQLWQDRHGLNGTMLAVTPSGQRLRAKIRRDFYDFQSTADVSAWTLERGWVHITSRHGADVRVFAFSSQTKDDTWREAIGIDLLELIQAAEDFLA